MVDSILPFYQKSKKKKKSRPDLKNLNLNQFFYQRYGIGRNISSRMFLYSGFHKSIKYGTLENKNYYVLLRYKDFFISKKSYLDSQLEEYIKNNIKNYVLLDNNRGKRHKLGMPVRGQRIKTNGKTAKKLRRI